MVESYERSADGLHLDVQAARRAASSTTAAPVDGEGRGRLDQALGGAHPGRRDDDVVRQGDRRDRRPTRFEIRLEQAVRAGARDARPRPRTRCSSTREAEAQHRSQRSRSTRRSARARSSSCARNGSPATRSSTSRTPTTCRATSRRAASPAARSPRSTASSGSYIPDANTAVQALVKGEVDIIEIPPTDFLPMLRGDPNITVKVIDRDRHPGDHAPEPPDPAVRPSGGAPGAALPRRRPERLSRLDDRQPRVRGAVLGGVRLRHAAREQGRDRRLGEGRREANLAKAKELLAGGRLQRRAGGADGSDRRAPGPCPGRWSPRRTCARPA